MGRYNNLGRYANEVLENAIGVLENCDKAFSEHGEKPTPFEVVKLAFLKELKEYRDICDSPEKLKLIDALYLERCEEINRLKAELAEYKKLEEEGVLLRLPCKVGDKVYNLIPRLKKANNFQENEVTTIKVYSDSVYIFLKNGLAKDTKQIGKTVFLTQEEAEQALERMKEVQDVN